MLQVKWFGPGEEYADAKAVRIAVFVEEQHFQEEFDERDAISHHIVLYDETGRPAGCGRLFADDGQAGSYVVGRVAVHSALRGTGAGRLIMEEIERRALTLGARRLRLSAQQQARPFYEKLGYVAYGEEYLEEHCPHMAMEKDISASQV